MKPYYWIIKKLTSIPFLTDMTNYLLHHRYDKLLIAPLFPFVYIRKYIQIYRFVKENKLKGWISLTSKKLSLPSSSSNFDVIDLQILHQINEIITEKCQQEYNFIDVGCGSGIALIYVQKIMKFKQYLGIDLSKELIEIFETNKLNSQTDMIDCKVADASIFRLSNSKSFILLFNPFDQNIMKKFIHNNRSVLTKTNSILFYVNCVHVDIFSEIPNCKVEFVKTPLFKSAVVKF